MPVPQEKDFIDCQVSVSAVEVTIHKLNKRRAIRPLDKNFRPLVARRHEPPLTSITGISVKGIWSKEPDTIRYKKRAIFTSFSHMDVNISNIQQL